MRELAAVLWLVLLQSQRTQARNGLVNAGRIRPAAGPWQQARQARGKVCRGEPAIIRSGGRVLRGRVGRGGIGLCSQKLGGSQ